MLRLAGLDSEMSTGWSGSMARTCSFQNFPGLVKFFEEIIVQ